MFLLILARNCYLQPFLLKKCIDTYNISSVAEIQEDLRYLVFSV